MRNKLMPARALSLGMVATMVFASASAMAVDEGRVVIGRGAEVYGPVTPFATPRAGDLRRSAEWAPGDPVREVPRRNYPLRAGETVASGEGNSDPLLDIQRTSRAPSLVVDLNFAGTGFTGATPPDTVGDVGPNHFVQAVNASTVRVYNKAGVLVGGPFEMDSLAPPGDPCASGSGDPIVLYDRLADRWFLQEFRTGSNRLCIYISQTPDPTGAYFFYGFNSPTFPDYPHFGIWPDAYYGGTNENGGGGNQTTYAFDRVKMLAGQPATMQRLVVVPPVSGYGFQTLTPADLDGGTAPPVGSGGIFMRHFDGEAHGSPNPATDLLNMYEMKVDWVTPANTVLTTLPSITVTDFNSWFVNYSTFASVPQPSTAQRLDPIREAILNRLVYRNFITHETLLGNYATNRNPATTGSVVSAGIRWFELRRVGGIASPWTLHDEGTFGGDDNSPTAQFFMGGIAMDRAGNIGLGYSKTNTSPAVFPSIGVTGRLAGDTPGTMGPETNVISGVQSQTGTDRWGDYAAMGMDPADDCTFWYTNEYMPGSSWGTRVVSFAFDECFGGFTMTPTPVVANVCALTDPDPTFSLDIASIDAFADSVALSASGLPPGTSAAFSINNVAPDFTSILTIQDTDLSESGSYSIEVTGTGSDDPATIRVTAVTLNLAMIEPATTALTSPSQGATDIGLTPTLTWGASDGAASYTVQIATDANFTNIVYTESVNGTSHQVASALLPTTAYFWRVEAVNLCGSGGFSPVRSFTTAAVYCAFPVVGIPDNNVAGVNSTITVPAGGTLTDLDVVFEARHTWIGDLVVTLTKVDSGTTVTLINRPGVPAATNGCNGDNPNIILDDEAAASVQTSCVNANPGYPIGGRFSPGQALSAFDGSLFAGDWRLNVSDRAAADTGFLDRWCLEPTTSGANNPPSVADQVFSVDEDRENGFIVDTIVATDPDLGDTLTFAVTGGTGTSAFAVATDTGDITVADASLLDFEANPVFTLDVTVTDDDGLSDSATITINVNDVNEAPVVLDQSFSADENAADGTVVGIIDATDPDAGDALTFSVTGGSGDTAFAVDATGEITVADFSQLNFETVTSFTLEVLVTDLDGLSASATITINLNDVNEAPVVLDQSFSVDENSADGTVVGIIDATDPDAGDALTFSVTGGSGDTAFAVDAATGEIAVADFTQLDFDTVTSFTLEVLVTDLDGSSDSATITIEIIEVANEAPVAGALDNQSGIELRNFSFDTSPAFSDPDGDALIFSATGLPASLTIDIDTGVISGIPQLGDAGAYTIVVSASDGEFAADSSFELEITDFVPSIFSDGFESAPN